MKIKRNAAKCRGCGFVLESTHRHDFRYHECVKDGKVYSFHVDGGTDYLRRLGGFDMYEDVSEYFIPAEQQL